MKYVLFVLEKSFRDACALCRLYTPSTCRFALERKANEVIQLINLFLIAESSCRTIFGSYPTTEDGWQWKFMVQLKIRNLRAQVLENNESASPT